MSASFTGQQRPNDGSSNLNSTAFLVQQLLARISTLTLVKVVSVTTDGGVTPVGFVDVQPLVNQLDGAGNATPHGTVFGLPYLRLQGGANAIILDPAVGDIGICGFASRDISSVKATKAVANPGSLRRFDMADGMFLGGTLNAAPTQYVQFNADGITLVSPIKVTISAPEIEIDGILTQGTGPRGGSATMEGPVTVNQDLTAEGTDVHTHRHGGVQPGSGDTGPPV